MPILQQSTANPALLQALAETAQFPVAILCLVLAGLLLARHLRADAAGAVPRWQQGLRPGAHGPTWDAMTPAERRSAFIGDIVVAVSGVLFIFWLWEFIEAIHAAG